MECDEDDGEHDPGVLVDIAAPHPEHCVRRVHQVGVHCGRVCVLVVMVANVHGGHEGHLMVVVRIVLAVVRIGPGVIVVDDVILILSLIAVVAVLLLLLYFDTRVASSMLVQKSLHSQESVPVKLDPLVSVAHTGVLYQGTENHEEAHEEIDVDTLHIGDLG